MNKQLADNRHIIEMADKLCSKEKDEEVIDWFIV